MQKSIALAAGFAIFLAWEYARPFFKYSKNHWVRTLHNIGIAALNGLIGRFVFAYPTYLVLSGESFADFGLLRALPLPAPAAFALGFLSLDLWTYWWHRINHTVPLFWRFHRAHHTDTEMDASTAFRFHPGEIVFSSLLRIPLFLLLGLPPAVLPWYEAVLAFSTLFHHANLGIGLAADAVVRNIVVSPIMHKLHHSVESHEFSSNYSSIFSWWDRLFGSWTETAEPEKIILGLRVYRDESRQRLWGILTTPFTSGRPKGGSPS